MQLATEPQVPGVPTWGDTPLAVESTAGTMKAKENSKRKDMNWFPTWSYLQSIQWPLSLVQVSMCKEGRKAGVVASPHSKPCLKHVRAPPGPVCDCDCGSGGGPKGGAQCSLVRGASWPRPGFLHTRGTQWDGGHEYRGALQAKEKRTKAMRTPVPFCISLGGSRLCSPSSHVH